MKKFIFILLLILSCLVQAQSADYLKHDIENQKQEDFPGLGIAVKEGPALYVVDINKASSKKPVSLADYIFEEKIKLNPGVKLKVSSYIIAKDLLDSVRFHSFASKTSREEIISIFNSGDVDSIQDLIMKLAEKRRGAKDKKELQKIQKVIDQAKEDGDASTAAYFRTGMIEVLPLSSKEFKGQENVRFFIPFEQIDHLDLSQGEAKISIIKSVSLLGFKNIKLNINYGSVSDDTIKLIDRAESSLQNFCLSSCLLDQSLKLGDFMNNIIAVSTYDLLSQADLDFDHLSEGAMIQQACLLDEMNQLCPNVDLMSSIKRIILEKKVASYLRILKQKFPQICSKFK